jgi:hypothetical protein
MNLFFLLLGPVIVLYIMLINGVRSASTPLSERLSICGNYLAKQPIGPISILEITRCLQGGGALAPL